MNDQEIFNQIRELQKQRTLLSTQDNQLICKINELRDKLKLKNIKKGYYTDNYGLFCKVYDIEDDSIVVYELDTVDPPCLTKETYYLETFTKTYCRECTKEEYEDALDKVVKYFKD